MTDRAESGRDAFARGAWVEAFAQLRDVDGLEQADVERLAVTAHLVGERVACDDAWELAQRLAASRGDAEGAARCAFWLGFDLMLRGEDVRASGWFARAERAASGAPDGPAAGLLMLPSFLAALGGGRAEDAFDMAVQMIARGRGTSDGDLGAFGLLCQGEALIALGRAAEGTRLLDEVMVSVTAGEVSPITTGIIYCAVIDACMHACDPRRAAAWTDALSAWCDADPSVVPYRGVCLVHRSQVLMASGAWERASTEVDRAQAYLTEPEHPALGDAWYQRAELHRVRGELVEAEAAYRAASRHGRDPVPGFALLRLAQGRLDAAKRSARRILHETDAHPDRSAILAAVVEILVAAGELDEAAAACDELDRRAEIGEMELLSAVALTARASLLLAQDEPSGAAGLLLDAIRHWRNLEMPYQDARARALIVQAFHGLGDVDAAELERESALATFERLGARSEVARLRAPAGDVPLTARECDVVRLVAAGRTNRQIAAELIISEHTVARHLQNIFVKLGCSSRAAATAYAYEHGIV